MLDNLLSAALLVGSLIAGYIFRGYLGSYASEKGKNLATKEDISEITSKIENVKASVQTLAHLKTDFEQQRRDWLLSFYDSAVEMHHRKFFVNFGDFPMDGGKELFDFQQSFVSIVTTMVKSYQRIVLYFENDHQLRVRAEKVLLSAIKAETVLRKKFSDVRIGFIQEAEAFKSGDRALITQKVDKSNAANKAYWDEMLPVREEFREAMSQYLSSLNEFLRKIEVTKI